MMDDLWFYVLFNSISVISDNGQMIMKSCAMKPRLRLKRSLPHAGIEPGTATSQASA